MTADEPPEIETLASRVVYRNRWMRVREDEIRRRDGSAGIYGVLEKPDAALIVPVEADGRLHLVQQFRYPVGVRSWEFPQGVWEHTPEADPLDLARGELREETGLIAAGMRHAGYLFQAVGYSTQGYNVFLATGLRAGAPAREQEEQDLICRTFPLAEVERMIRAGEIKDGSTVAAFGLLRLKGLI